MQVHGFRTPTLESLCRQVLVSDVNCIGSTTIISSYIPQVSQLHGSGNLQCKHASHCHCQNLTNKAPRNQCWENKIIYTAEQLSKQGPVKTNNQPHPHISRLVIRRSRRAGTWYRCGILLIGEIRYALVGDESCRFARKEKGKRLVYAVCTVIRVRLSAKKCTWCPVLCAWGCW